MPESTEISLDEKIAIGKKQASIAFLSNAEFISRFIDHASTLDESYQAVPKTIIYLLQALLHSTEERESYKDLTMRLALFEHAPANSRELFPRINLANDLIANLEILKARILPLVIEEDAISNPELPASERGYSFNKGFAGFELAAVRLVDSHEFLTYARNALPEIAASTKQIKDRELQLTEQLSDDSWAREVKTPAGRRIELPSNDWLEQITRGLGEWSHARRV